MIFLESFDRIKPMGTVFIFFLVTLLIIWLIFLYSVRIYWLVRIYKSMKPKRCPVDLKGFSQWECRSLEFHVERRHRLFQSVLLKKKKRKQLPPFTLKATLVNPSGNSLLVYCHKEGESREKALLQCREFIERGWAVLTYDQRAHGESEGTSFTFGYCESEDLATILEELTKERRFKEIALYGVCTGSTTALLTLQRFPHVSFVIGEEPITTFCESISWELKNRRFFPVIIELVIEYLLRQCELFFELPLREICPLYGAINHPQVEVIFLATTKKSKEMAQRILENRPPDSITSMVDSHDALQQLILKKLGSNP